MHPTFAWGALNQTIALWTGVIPAILSLTGAVVVLATAVAIWLNPATRSNLRRQSLQMLLCVQAMSLIYSSAYLVQTFITGPTKWCDVVTIFTLFASNFIEFVVMLIPVNLQLVLVHQVNTDGFLRYYLLAPLGAAIITALPGAVQSVWGWDPETRMCWIYITEPHVRISWLVGAWYTWLLISMVVSTASATIVLLYLVFHTRSRNRELAIGEGNSGITSNNGVNVKRVASRIMLYPLVLITANCVSAIGNFTIIRAGGIKSEGTYVLCVISGIMYGLVPGAYALIALFVDPCFSRALRVLLARRTPVEKTSTEGKPRIQIEITTQVVSNIMDAVHRKETRLEGRQSTEKAKEERREEHRVVQIVPMEHMAERLSNESEGSETQDMYAVLELARL
ncbi:hypothetical protein GLOTRDRAFT_128046 [Gloeophyllum trabeum ATCC 11539]|uniref:G-protein coupled receptors family 2 profile 2 domain-containing protein n=1 Tax=Gloeophyllum trabeum (strain ATCC 11539 / FP-39264 / Madison 617) TaxID=670483 RepID=S7Q9S3_GLOTA|nr:uncharacterized protein GLOTRDRAFT_128046 [Gloeophyllum trabeum ATCC 11539]EPQ56088.1 hypothetical protein GLOTRDRAFT_128046 [Gloeophyllum trabeum ATCC 11539]